MTFMTKRYTNQAPKPLVGLAPRRESTGTGCAFAAHDDTKSPVCVSCGSGLSEGETSSSCSSGVRKDESRKHRGTNIFLRNLAPQVEPADIEKLFSGCGTILSAAVMRNIHTGNSLGTGFVRFATHLEAKGALAQLNGRCLQDRPITIQWAKRSEGAPVGAERESIMKLFVRNIPTDISPEALRVLFSAYGPVERVSTHKDTAPIADRRLERRIAFVIYSVPSAASRAASAVHNTKPFASCNGVPLMVKLAEDKTAKPDRRVGALSNVPTRAAPFRRHTRSFQLAGTPTPMAHAMPSHPLIAPPPMAAPVPMMPPALVPLPLPQHHALPPPLPPAMGMVHAHHEAGAAQQRAASPLAPAQALLQLMVPSSCSRWTAAAATSPAPAAAAPTRSYRHNPYGMSPVFC